MLNQPLQPQHSIAAPHRTVRPVIIMSPLSQIVIFQLTLSSSALARFFLLGQLIHRLHPLPLTSPRAKVALLLALLAFYQPLASHLVPNCQPLLQLGRVLQALTCGK